MSSKPTIGLTGGIASGKSKVAELLRGLGAAVVDADQVARDVMAKGSPGLAEVVGAFGKAVLASDGSLDRDALGSIVFGDPDARAKLQAITHPRIAQRSAERLASLAAGPAPYVVYEAPLLVETGAHKRMDALVVVAASPQTQERRVRERDGLTPDAARARIDAQLPLAEKLKVADYTIHNEGGLVELAAQVRAVHHAIVERFELASPSAQGSAGARAPEEDR